MANVHASLQGDVLLYEEQGTNVAYEFSGELGDTDEAFASADYVRQEEFYCHRHTGNPLETRGLVASYDPGRHDITVWGETKVPHFNRGVLAELLQIPEHRIHFIEPDVGGGFGIRGEFYPENFIVPFASMKVGRPVKWIEDRREHLTSANQSRESLCRLEDRRYQGRHASGHAGANLRRTGRVRPHPRGRVCPSERRPSCRAPTVSLATSGR